MTKVLLFFVFTTIAIFQVSFCSEIDSVTPRNVQLDNSRNDINSIFNQRLLEGVQNANIQPVTISDLEFDYFSEPDEEVFCDEERLYAELRKAIFQSFTASWGLKGYALDLQLRKLLASKSYSLSLNDSIYRDIDYLEGFSLNLKELSDVVNINGHLIGLDKLGHFFSEGWQYFELTEFDNRSMDEALEWGRQQEAGKFGYTTTGIFSFADLVANFNGWRFWNKILLPNKDPLKGAVANFLNRPYVSCEIQIMDSIKNRKIIKAWEYNNKFDISDYLDGSWDEGNNCNSYDDPVIEQKVALRIRNVNAHYSCPVKVDSCQRSRKKYGHYAKQLLHPFCLVVTDD